MASSNAPGLTSRNVAKSRQQYHNDYFWEPGTSAPQRASNLSNAFQGG